MTSLNTPHSIRLVKLSSVSKYVALEIVQVRFRLHTLTSLFQLLEELLQVLHRPEVAVDRRVVDDVVAEVAPPGLVERREPDAPSVARDADVLQVVQFLHHTWKLNVVTIRISMFTPKSPGAGLHS